MNTIHEKLFLGITLLLSSAVSGTGAYLTTDATRWIFLTLASSFMMSGFLALMCKKIDENIQIVAGRCGFSIMGGILATKPVVHYFGLAQVTNDDAVALLGVSSAVCLVTFFVGFAGLRIFEAKAPDIAEKWFKKIDPS